MNIKNWLENIAGSFQPAYDRIKSWSLSPEVDKLLDDVWAKIPKALQGSIFKLVKELYDKYGKELAAEIIKKIMKTLKDALD